MLIISHQSWKKWQLLRKISILKKFSHLKGGWEQVEWPVRGESWSWRRQISSCLLLNLLSSAHLFLYVPLIHTFIFFAKSESDQCKYCQASTLMQCNEKSRLKQSGWDFQLVAGCPSCSLHLLYLFYTPPPQSCSLGQSDLCNKCYRPPPDNSKVNQRGKLKKIFINWL